MCGIVCVILCLRVSVEDCLVSDRQTHDNGIYCASTALHGKKYNEKSLHYSIYNYYQFLLSTANLHICTVFTNLYKIYDFCG